MVNDSGESFPQVVLMFTTLQSNFCTFIVLIGTHVSPKELYSDTLRYAYDCSVGKELYSDTLRYAYDCSVGKV